MPRSIKCIWITNAMTMTTKHASNTLLVFNILCEYPFTLTSDDVNQEVCEMGKTYKYYVANFTATVGVTLKGIITYGDRREPLEFSLETYLEN